MANPLCIGVCPGTGGTNDRKVGSPKLTISSGVAILDVAQTGALIGPGTCIRVKYASTYYYYYVYEVLSSTQFRVIERGGGVPADITSGRTIMSITFPYASLSAGEAGIYEALSSSYALTTKDVQVFLYVYAGASADTTDCVVDGYTTDATRNINIVAASAKQTLDGSDQRWNGVENSNKYQLRAKLTCSDPFTIVNGLQIYGTSSSNVGAVAVTQPSCVTRNCLLKAGGSQLSGTGGFDCTDSSATSCIIENCVILNFSSNTASGVKLLSANNLKIYHCTIAGCYQGVAGNATNSQATIVNCLVFNNSSADWYYMSATQPNCYNNCSDDTPLGSKGIDASPGSVEADDWALLVKDYANGDVRPLNAYSPIYRAGRGWYDDNTLPTTDIKGDSRHLTTPSIGAYERSVDGKGYGQMDIWVSVSETLKKLITGYVLDEGIWKPLRSVYVLVDGVWEQIYVLSIEGHVFNPSFEMWDGGNLRYFTLVGTGATITKDTSDYYADGTSVRLTRGSAGGMLYQDVHNDEGLSYWKGHKVHADVMCKADDPSTVCVRIEDGVGSSTHTHHSGSGEWEKLKAEIDVDAAATMVRVILDAGGGVAGKSARFDLLNLYVV